MAFHDICPLSTLTFPLTRFTNLCTTLATRTWQVAEASVATPDACAAALFPSLKLMLSPWPCEALL